MNKSPIFLFLFLFYIVINNPVLAQWTKTSCPDEVRITAIETKGDSVFASTIEEMYISTDNGSNWENIWNGLPYFGYFRTIVANMDNIYVGTQDGVYLSTDGGGSFTLADNGFTGGFVSTIAIKDTLIYLGACWDGTNWAGVYVSDDECASWDNISGNMPLSVDAIKGLAITDGLVFAGTSSGVFVSVDNGLNWIERNNGLLSYGVNCLAIDGENLYAGTQNGLFISGDEGKYWEKVLNGLPADEWVTSILVTGAAIIVGGDYGGGVYVSTDSGITWADASDGLSSMQVTCLAFNGTDIYAGTGAVEGFYTGGVYRQTLDELVSVKEKQVNQISLKIYPNPATTKIALESEAEILEVTLFNTFGQVVWSENVQGKHFEINISGMEGGMYFVRIKTKEGAANRRFIVSK